ncbi:MAG: hypothetical protein O3A51_03650, partial [Verrucomicrobia bacterium]|nr:hypothetical protein [Verrucomicrobiota bacterium]
MNKRLTLTGIAAGLLLVAAQLQAAIVIEETFDTVGDDRDWVHAHESGPDTGTPDVNAALAGSEGPASTINVSDGLGGFPSVDTLSTSGGDGAGFLGDYLQNGGHFFCFDFFFDEADFAGSTGLEVFFTDGGPETWYYTIDVSGQGASSWATYSVNLNNQFGWYNEGDETGFLGAAGAVSEIGFRITYL